MIFIKKKLYIVNLLYSSIIFRSIIIKLYYKKKPDFDKNYNNTIIIEISTAESQSLQLDQSVIWPVEQAQSIIQPAKRSCKRFCKNLLLNFTAYFQDDKPALYTALYQSEINELLKKNIFKIVDSIKLSDNIWIFKFRFIDKVKNKNTDKAFEKSCLVIQVYNNQKKNIVLTQLPTIQKVSQCLILYIAAMLADNKKYLFLYNIFQIYI